MDYKDKTVAFGTLGCKLNFSETSTIARSFIEKGFKRVDFKEKADVYVINTCSVTDTADKKSKTIIRQAARQNPAAFVVVTGCYAQLKPEDAAAIQGVDLVLGANDKFNITKYLDNLEKHEAGEVHACTFAEINDFQRAFSYGDRTRSFLKVQDGCNYFCTYCTIPLARGKSRNPSVASIIDEAKAIAGQGIKEIILTGVNIGDFGRSTDESFLGLLQALDQIDTIARIRIGSVEPNLLSDEIINFVATSQRIAPHFHIPLQAGTDEVLSLMKRRYTTDLFARRIDQIRSTIPHAFIGVDMIAGMNGETPALFQQAYHFIEKQDVSQLHVFPYSERANTAALKIDGSVPVEERRNRTQQLIALSDGKLKTFYNKHIGEEALVLFENQKGKTKMQGWTANYIKVEAPYEKSTINQLRKVRLSGLNEDGSVKVELL